MSKRSSGSIASDEQSRWLQKTFRRSDSLFIVEVSSRDSARASDEVRGENVTIVSELAIWQELVLFCLALLALFYVFYFKIWVALATG